MVRLLIFLKTGVFFIRGQSLQKSTTFLFLRFLVIIYNSYLEPCKSFRNIAIIELPTANRKKVIDI